MNRYAFNSLPLFDHRWTSMTGIAGPVRTAPRGNRFWHCVEHEESYTFLYPYSDLLETINEESEPAGTVELSKEEAPKANPTGETISTVSSEDNDMLGVQLSDMPMGDDECPITQPVAESQLRENARNAPLAIITGPAVILTPVNCPTANETEKCTCPLSYDCQLRKTKQLDCRKLTSEWKSWKRRMDQDAYSSQLRIAISVTISSTKPAPLAQLQKLDELLTRVKQLKVESPISKKKNICEKIRNWILKMQQSDVMTKDIVDSQVVQHLEKFLDPTVPKFWQDQDLGSWIEEELTVIMRKWRRGDLQCNPKRGLLLVKASVNEGTDINKKSHEHYKVDPAWLHRMDARYHGNGSLVNGQTWFSRVELMRDGVHAMSTAGISGSKAEGAYSVVMTCCKDESKNDGYANIDFGNQVEYMGTSLQPGKELSGEGKLGVSTQVGESLSPTDSTAALMKSLRTQKPVRLIRAFELPLKGQNKIAKVYRYDGLYQVIGQTLLDEAKQEWRFKMHRMRGQMPLRPWKPDDILSDPDSVRQKRESRFSSHTR